MNTWLRQMRFLSVTQTVIAVLRVLATFRFALTVLRAGQHYYLKRKGS